MRIRSAGVPVAVVAEPGELLLFDDFEDNLAISA